MGQMNSWVYRRTCLDALPAWLIAFPLDYLRYLAAYVRFHPSNSAGLKVVFAEELLPRRVRA